MRQSEFKTRYDPELGRFTRQHIYGEGVMDVFKNIGAKVIGQTLKKAAKTAASKAVTTAAHHEPDSNRMFEFREVWLLWSEVINLLSSHHRIGFAVFYICATAVFVNYFIRLLWMLRTSGSLCKNW